jgi:hypothetical protein
LAQLNDKVKPVEQVVMEATEKRKQQLLLSDKPYNLIETVKIVPAMRKGKMGKHGMLIRPSRINKKKVKKMMHRKAVSVN